MSEQGGGATMRPQDLAPWVLQGALRAAAAAGWRRERAAVELLIAHQTWLERAELGLLCDAILLDEFPVVEPTLLAEVDWGHAIELAKAWQRQRPADAAVLLVAAWLAEGDLGRALSALDDRCVPLVAQALSASSGTEPARSGIVNPQC